MIYNDIVNDIESFSDERLASYHQRFFKTQKGEYGEGDKFLGLTIPQNRELVKKYIKIIDFNDIQNLIKNEYHEIRLFALLTLAEMSKKEKNTKKLKKIADLYIKNLKFINNWDLVDLSSYFILGKYCYLANDNKIITNLSENKSNENLKAKNLLLNLWANRISIVSTFYYIKENSFNLTIELCKKFLDHKHDLIHKATGWMLREVGKRNVNILRNFLDEFCGVMPRTMLRYAIEKFDTDTRKFYMQIK